jgi:hypothetical protein
MRLIMFVAVTIVVWAAFVSIGASVHPLASLILTLAVAIQRLNVVQKWISNPTSNRRQNVEIVAQQTLINLCKDKIISSDTLGLRIHVWEVPLWYRNVFPYALRTALKKLMARSLPRNVNRFTLRPTLRRVAAIGLLKQPPSGVRFRKGFGLIGVCIANNNRSEYINFDVYDAKHSEALHSTSATDWRSYGPEITHNLTLTDAKKLSHSYGQVVSLVVQNPDSGEAIGCVTISAKQDTSESFDVATSEIVREHITTLALTVAPLIA